MSTSSITPREEETQAYWLASKCWRGQMAKGDNRGPNNVGELMETLQRLAHFSKQLGICATNDLMQVINQGEVPSRVQN